MYKIVGVRFKPAGKVYNFDAGLFVLKLGDSVIVETENGLSFGIIVTPPEVIEEEPKIPLKKVHRLANENDFSQLDKNLEVEKAAQEFCLECIQQLNLKMNLFSVESTFDSTKLTFYFTAEGRVDFRQLVKMLVKEYRIRIEMRQVGIRNQAKMCGGIGRCGRMICCSQFLEKFDPVSIRMAKEQNLSLNPTKISGLCGRLMCCLTFENETYKILKKEFPKIGKRVKIANCEGKVIRHNVIGNKIGIKKEDGHEIEVKLDEIAVKS